MLRRMLNLRMLLVLVVVIALAVAAWFWYRGSSLVRIKHVQVTGLSGPDVAQIRQALTQSALTMTTLNLSMQKLENSVQGYPEVSSLTTTTHGSHNVTIAVVEKIPVAVIGSSLIDGGGYVLPSGASAQEHLPRLKVKGAGAAYTTTDGQVTGRDNLSVLRVLAAAPYKFLAHIANATFTNADGVVLQLRNGPQLRFGSAAGAAQKWDAALAVLGSSGTNGASYIDVTDPQHPAAGTEHGASDAATTG